MPRFVLNLGFFFALMFGIAAVRLSQEWRVGRERMSWKPPVRRRVPGNRLTAYLGQNWRDQ